jgi:hypothetical protein
MPTFIGNSNFSRQALRNLFESPNSFLAAWALNVPVDTPGDRSTWTWAANWSQYRVPGLIHSIGETIMSFTSTGSLAPAEIDIRESYTHPSPGAYYLESPTSSGNTSTRIFNNTGGDADFTHVALFVQQPNELISPTATDTDTYMVAVVRIQESEEPITLINNNFINLICLQQPESYPCAINTCYASFQDFADIDKLEFLDEIEETGLYLNPKVFSSTGGSRMYTAKTQVFPYLKQGYKDMLCNKPEFPAASFIGEALNVTGAEPDFEEAWTSWQTYRINRYSVVTLPTTYKYENQSAFFETTFMGETFSTTWYGESISMRDPVEFVFTAPSSGSYTYNTIAVFLNPTNLLPLQGQNITYPNLDNFIGVIKLDTAMTLTAGNTARAYPFNVQFMLNPNIDFEEL